jgi:hypothetical protein
MLTNHVKKVTLTAQSVVKVTEGDVTRNVAIETYVCSMDTNNPENMSLTKTYASTEGKALYEDHRTECRRNYTEFQQMAYELQDEMFAAQEA